MLEHANNMSNQVNNMLKCVSNMLNMGVGLIVI